MNIVDGILRLCGLQRRIPVNRKYYRSAYAGASSTRLTYDWQPSTVTGDNALRTELRTLIDRSRGLERNNDYIRRWLSALENNITGGEGCNLQMKIKFRSGRFDKGANEKIERAWKEWSKSKYCSLNGEDTWADIQRIAIRSTARDGGVLVNLIKGADNPFGFALELMEIDMLDFNYCEAFPNGNMVRLGIERNSSRQVVGYWLLRVHPGEFLFPQALQTDRYRVPVERILHYFIKERPTQSIGIPWCVSPMTRLHNLEQYQLAELQAARRGSEKGGWFQSDDNSPLKGWDETSTDENGNVTTNTLLDFQPGSFDQLPAGFKFTPYSPDHPNPPFNDFCRSTLHGVSMGLDIDYPTLSGDLREANYSSMRSGKLEAQETWKKNQAHFIDHFCIPIFEMWLEMAILTGAINLPMSKFEAMNVPKFRGRRWPWVDPSVDVKAAIESINAGLKTRTEVIAENGGDLEDTFEQLADEKTLASDLGLNFDQDGIVQKPRTENPVTDSEGNGNGDSQNEMEEESEEEGRSTMKSENRLETIL